MAEVMHALPEGPWVPRDDFAARLIQIRHHLRLSQDVAAERCGLNPNTWATWELGRSPRQMDKVVSAIVDGLGVDRDWLMWGAVRSRCSFGRLHFLGLISAPVMLPLGHRAVPHLELVPIEGQGELALEYQPRPALVAVGSSV